MIGSLPVGEAVTGVFDVPGRLLSGVRQVGPPFGGSKHLDCWGGKAGGPKLWENNGRFYLELSNGQREDMSCC